MKKKSILVVEDDPVISLSIKDLLEDNDYVVILAVNGSEALTALKTTKDFSLILLDLMMPVMDGFQIQRKPALGSDH